MKAHAFQHRGNQADFVLGTRVDGWKGFDVVRFRAVEELSQPFRYDIVLRRRVEDGPVNLDDLLDGGASFRIACEERWRTVHGIIVEAEEVDRTDKLFYYRVLLAPHLVRSMYRRRCRTFVQRTLGEIIESVLENRTQDNPTGLSGLTKRTKAPTAAETMPDFDDFREPRGEYMMRVSDEARLKNAQLYRFVAQYNESDFDFVSRLLEQEGISYYFEHTNDSVVMILTDAPGQKPLFAEDAKLTMRAVAQAGASADQEVVRGLRESLRNRSRSVAMREYDWRRSNQVFTHRSEADEAHFDYAGHYEFPAKDDQLDQPVGQFPSKIRLERFEAERQLREGFGTIRTMEPGHRIELHDGDNLRDDIDLLIVRVESMATQHDVAGSELEHEHFGFRTTKQSIGAYENRFVVLGADVPFRPAMITPKPRIHGLQVARVTAEESGVVTIGDGVVSTPPDIHCDEYGNVRIRFPWDQRKPEENTPSSDWVRVAHFWAGSDYGAQHVPRVGHEVLVAFMQGDPDRPVIVGRVYNPQSPPPYPPTASAKAKTQTTWKSASSSVTERTEGFNEFRFTDYTGEQEVYLQAEKDFNELVKDSHSTSVGGNQSNSVGNDQSNSVKGNRTHDVVGTESVHVHGNRTTQFDANEDHTVNAFLTTNVGANEEHTVGGFLKTKVGANETREIGAFRGTKVGANDDLNVGAWRNTTVGSGENRTVSGPDNVTVSGDRRVTVGGSQIMNANANHEMGSTNTYIRPSGDFQVNSTTAGFNQTGSFYVNVNGCTISCSAGKLVLDNGAGAAISLVGGIIVVKSGGPTNLTAGGPLNATAPTIKLNG
ncbi:MAG: type VI secretion system tip protein VgrG [Polyangiaceae bacterium]|nr:type VI secretion system tip protein VgrG [Polyangiaceae bacterium]